MGKTIFKISLFVLSLIYLFPANLYAYSFTNETIIKYIFFAFEAVIYFAIVIITIREKGIVQKIFLVYLFFLVLLSYSNGVSTSQIYDRELRSMLLLLLPISINKLFEERDFLSFVKYFKILIIISASFVVFKALSGDPNWDILPTPGIAVTEYDELKAVGLFRIYSNTIALAVMFYLITFFSHYEKRERNISNIIVFCSSIIILLFYYSRLIFLILALLTLLIALKENKTNKISIVILIFAFAFILNIITGNILAERVISLVAEFTQSGGSFMYRVYEFGAAINSIINNPLFGVGIGAPYREPLGLIESNELYETPEVGLKMIHNGILFLLVKGGIFLTALYLFIYKKYFVLLYQNNKIKDPIISCTLLYQIYYLTLNVSADFFFQMNHAIINYIFISYSMVRLKNIEHSKASE